MATHFFRTDSLGHPAFFEPQLVKAEQTEGLDGTFSLELTAIGAVEISKGDHLIYRDDVGVLRDSVVVSPAVSHGTGGLTTSIICKDRVATDAADLFIVDQRNTQPTPIKTVLSKLFDGTPYTPTNIDTNAPAISFYHKDLWTCLCDLSKATGMEIYRAYSTDSAGHKGSLITAATVGLTDKLGKGSGELRRFDYGVGLTGVTRTVNADSVITCMYGYGKGLETDKGGHSRKLTFGSVNGGKDYVVVSDADYAKKWGIPDPVHGNVKYRIGTYENSDCEDAQQLLRETKAALAKASQPSVTYELDALLLDSDHVRLGETVAVVDSELGLRLTARVSKRVTNLLSGRATISLGAQSESFTTQTQSATSTAAASATGAVATAQAAAATQADVTPTVSRVSAGADGWDKAATLAGVIQLVNGLPEIVYDGKKYIFAPETGTFKEAQ